MDSLQFTGGITLTGAGKGRSGNPNAITPFPLSMMNAFTSLDTGGDKATKALFYPTRTLTLSNNETFDLTNFTDALGDVAVSMSIVRFWVLYHLPTSLATTGIRVGAAATPFPFFLDTAATTRTLLVGHGFGGFAPTATGVAVTAGMGVKVTNLDASNTATYLIGVFGE